MEKVATDITLAVFGLGGGEIILVIALVLIVFGAKRLADLARGFGSGLDEFRDATKQVGDEVSKALKDDDTRKTESGIAYDALTHNNQTAEFVYSSNDDDRIDDFLVAVAQGFGVGRIRPVRPLVGPLLGFAWFVLLIITRDFFLYLLGTMGGLAISVWVCGKAARVLKQKDAPSIVFDEITAVPLCFLPWAAGDYFFYTGHILQNWPAVLLMLALFRFFGVIKVWPIRQTGRLPRGWGITMDDVIAALYAGGLSLLFVQG